MTAAADSSAGAGVQPPAQILEDPPAGARLARVPERLANALHAAVGMRDGALLLRVDGRREDHVGLRLERLGREGGERDHGARRGHVRLGGVGLEEEQDAPAVTRGAVGIRQAGTEPGRAAHLAESAAVGLGGNPDQAGFLLAADPERVGHREQRLAGLAAAVAGDHALAPDDHDVARVAHDLRSGAHRVRATCAAPVRAAGDEALRTRGRCRRGRRASRRRGRSRARPRARRGRPRRRRARTGGPRRRRRRASTGGSRRPRAARRCAGRPCGRGGPGSAPRPRARCPARGSRPHDRCPRPARTDPRARARARGGPRRIRAPRRRPPRCPARRDRSASGAAPGSPLRSSPGRPRGRPCSRRTSPGARQRRTARAPRWSPAGSRRCGPSGW